MLKIRACTKGRSQFNIKPIDIHCTTKSNIKISAVSYKKCPIYSEAFSMVNKIVVSISSWYLKKHLQFGKINASWISHLLTDEQKRTCIANAKKKKKKKLLKMYAKYILTLFYTNKPCILEF